jgi:ketopantoate reductase
MKILVYGAGPLGSVFAARLRDAGHDVSILARGQRLADLREHGIVLHSVITDARTVTRVNVVEHLAPDDIYDLVLVIMCKNNALDILPILAANKNTPNVLFLTNNAAGPAELVEALGRERVLMGFPSAAGYRREHVVYYMAGTTDKPMAIPFGEIDGRITERARQIAEALESMEGYKVEIRSDIDAWLKSHVALLMPSLAPALYASDTDNERMADTRDAVVLAIRAMREGFRVLRALHIPVVPAKLRVMFEWLPEPLAVYWGQRIIADPKMKVALSMHASAARDEVKHLADEFMELARKTSVPTPAINRLRPYLDSETPPMPEGSAKIALDWRGVRLWCGAILGLLLLVVARKQAK